MQGNSFLKTNQKLLGAGNGELLFKECMLSQSCPPLCDPIFCSPQGSSVCGILQARVPEWVAISFSNASSLMFQICKVTKNSRDLLSNIVQYRTILYCSPKSSLRG